MAKANDPSGLPTQQQKPQEDDSRDDPERKTYYRKTYLGPPVRIRSLHAKLPRTEPDDPNVTYIIDFDAYAPKDDDEDEDEESPTTKEDSE